VREHDLVALRERLGDAEHELEDLRAIRDALSPPELPTRPGLDLAAAFLPAAERVSGDFYLVADGPQDAPVLVVGDVVGHGLAAARRAAFLRTAFAATAPFSDDPRRLLSWANAALIERDLVHIQGHSSPGIYARAFLEGRLTEEQMRTFRQEVGGNGLSSYPHAWLMPDFWQFPTVSMGSARSWPSTRPAS
jgi:hypothetical protein